MHKQSFLTLGKYILIPYTFLAINTFLLYAITFFKRGTDGWVILVNSISFVGLIYYLFVGLIYCPVFLPIACRSFLKNNKTKPLFSRMLGFSLGMVFIIFLPIILIVNTFCILKISCDNSEPASFGAVMIFLLLLNLFTVTMSTALTHRLDS